jgi:hypothetical protein
MPSEPAKKVEETVTESKKFDSTKVHQIAEMLDHHQ